jgi:DNA-binding response OmpR family regulator
VAKTLLAVDDSATMRKVLEITFSGEDFRVITAENSQAAYGKLAESPAVIVVDTMLGGEDGYAVAKELHWRSPDAAIILLASRYSPYDLARGRDAGADDWADKPFDTQQLIDKVRKIVHAKEASGTGGGRVVQATTSSSHPYRERAAAMPPPIPSSSHSVSPPARPAARASAGAASSPQRSATSTLVFGDGQQAPPPLPTSAASQPTPVAAASAPAIASAVNGQLGAKLGELGLTPTQAEAVLALSRQVVERVVWEVVPQLAETMIKEEITRLTKE